MSTLTPIATQTLSSAAASVTFSGIPQTYTDLVIVSNAIPGPTGGGDIVMQFNGDTGSNYSITSVYGNGSSAISYGLTNQVRFRLAYHTPSIVPMLRISVMNYSNTTTNKTGLCRSDAPSNAPEATVGLWRSTAAITSLTIFSTGGNIVTGSTFTLYGIGAGSPKAFGGDEVRTDGTYWYHIYNSSGVFAPVTNLSNVDYLVVGGGGGGGSRFGGGGGAGGYRTSAGTSGGNSSAESKLSLIGGTNYTVTVGAGGAGGATSGGTGTNGASNGTSGSQSVFGSITSSGGGGGGAGDSNNGLTGGSGGGGAGRFTSTGGTGTTNQGFQGGNSSGISPYRGSGGGGASAAGGAGGTATPDGAGGNGISSTITGSSITRAGGGGGGGSGDGKTAGGFGGAGGGGNGADFDNNPAATSGSVNTGSGGGGGAYLSGGGQSTGAEGGSGIVVIRYSAV